MAKVIVRAGKIGIIVFLPILITFVVLYALHVSSSAQDIVEGALPDSPTASQPESLQSAVINPDKLADTIRRLRSSNKFSQIQTLCNDILAKETDPDVALVVSQALIETAIETRDTVAADAQTQALLAAFAAHPGLTKSLCEIGDTHRRMHDYALAQALYEQIVNTRQPDPYSMWAQKNLCTLYAEQRKVAETEQAIATLTALYANHSEYPKALCDAADACNKAGRADRALELYEILVGNYPTVEHIVWAQKNRCLIHIDRKEFAELDAQLARLKTVFATNQYIARAVFEVAEGLRWKGQPDRAVDLFLSIPRQYPADPMALWAFKDACVIGIEQAHPDIETRISALTAGFATDKRLAQALCEVGDGWRKAGDFARCIQTYQQVIERFPKDVFALWSQKNLTTLAIEQKQADQADAAFQRLIDNHRDHPELGRAVNDIADAARAAGDPARVRMACQFVIDQFPMTTDSLWARQKLIVLEIWKQLMTVESPSSVPSEIQEALDRFIADYRDYDDMPLAVVIVGDIYRNRGFRLYYNERIQEAVAPFKIALSVFDRVIWDLPHINNSAAEAAYLSGEILIRLEDFESGIAHFKMVVDRWPNFRFAGPAQHRLIQNYDSWMRQGGIPRELAEPIIRQACRELDEKFLELAGGGQSVLFWLEADSQRGTL